MATIFEGITIETFPEAVRRGNIQPGQRFTIVVEGTAEPVRPSLSDIAVKMRATAAARGLTTEIFDTLLAED